MMIKTRCQKQHTTNRGKLKFTENMKFQFWTVFLLSLWLKIGECSSPSSTFDLVGAPCFAAANKKFVYDGCKEKDRECLCHNPTFLGTIALCIEEYSHRDSKIVDIGFSKVIKRCQSFTETNLTVSAFRDILAWSRINGRYFNNTSESTKFIHRRPFNVDPIDIVENIAVKQVLLRNHDLSELVGFSLMMFIFTVVFSRIIGNFVYKVWAKLLTYFDGKISRFFRRFFLLPAMFHQHHSEPAKIGKFEAFSIPTRVQTLVILIYYMTIFVFLFVGYEFKFPNFMYDTKARQLLRLLGDRAGIVSITQVPIIILFGGRNNFLIWLTGWPIDVFNVYHKWISRGILVLLLVHAISFSLSFTLAGSYGTVWSKAYWIFGVTAFSSGVVIFVQSLRVLRQRNYELFLASHIALAAVFLGAAWNHLKELGEMEYLYAAVAVWGTDRIARVIRILWSGPSCNAQMIAYGDGVFKVTITYSKRWKITPGTYVFVSLLDWESFWQFHPFSAVSPIDDDDNTLTIYAKAKNGFTRDLYLKLCRQQGRRQDSCILLEGPYGCQHALYRYDEVFIIAGGVGITGVYNYAADMRKNSQREHSVQLIWVIPDERPLEWFGDQIDYLSSAEQFQCTIYITGTGNSTFQTEKPTTFGQYRKMRGKPDVDSFVRRCIVNASGKLAVLSCGPGSMNDQVRKAVAENIQSASSRLDYFEESFSW